MLRLLEIFLFLAPFVAFALWRVFAPASGPSPRVLAAAFGAILLMAGALYWFSRREVLPAGSTYVPAELRDGRIVPGHAAPR